MSGSGKEYYSSNNQDYTTNGLNIFLVLAARIHS